MSVNTSNPVTFMMPAQDVDITVRFAQVTPTCTFPVTVNSSPDCILQAYHDSGYWNLIDAQHQSWAESDPVGYLKAHPYLYDAYPQYFAQTPSTTTPPPSTTSTTSACTFPVTVNSPPSCIMQAFQQSGYWSLLNSSQQAAAQSDPAGWLADHPYLYDAYPQYFAQAT